MSRESGLQVVNSSERKWSDREDYLNYGSGGSGDTYGFSGGQFMSPRNAVWTDAPISSYDGAATSLEVSISASAGVAGASIPGCLTDYVGIFGSAVTPLGGGDVGAGFYSDCYGMVGAYFSLGPSVGIPSISAGIAAGRTSSFAGESVSASGGLSIGPLGVSGGETINPSTGQITGEQVSIGGSFGPPIGASASFTSTLTTEFTSIYLGYIQFLNQIGYPGGAMGSAGIGDDPGD